MFGQSEAGPAAAGADLVRDVTTASFRDDVIAASMKQPVLVDFWAPWCGPCRQLTPVIEKAVQAAGGKVRLAKMNIDEHPQIAGQLGIQSIPAVIAFQKGQPVDGFMGALPESQVRGFIERLVGPLGADIAGMIAEADGLAAAGDAQGAAEIFAAVLSDDPANPKALGGLARLQVEAGDIEAAKALLATLPAGGPEDPAIAAARAAVELAEQAASLGDTAEFQRRLAADPNDHQARFDLALALNAAGKKEEAADNLLEIVKRNRSWNEEGARKQLLQFFEAWGPMDEATISARRKLSATLFS